MNKFRMYLLFLLPLIIVGREYYPRYKENQQLEELKSQFQGLLFEEDGKVKVTSLRVEENVISLQVHISNVDLSDTNKEVLTRNSRKMLPAKICNSVGISEWLSNGKWISVDVTANGSKPVTNVRITNDNCT
ncbi:hypothetical protein [Vibrio sp. Isolate30]|uniref:hypothetical protein n=1 Tax=Vibrio sp. Isolate30 TaxID=2908536 RepID=UPI001EFCB3B5|nr:hypothetical protein [Vibrio sp. Isolate30]MCG9632476.1 hypothetical protein [Vibrio sp. Isolate30]